MKENIVIVPHLGLGDHLITHGAVRKIYESNDFEVMIIPVKEHFYSNVSFMFRDLSKISYVKVPNDSRVENVSAHLRNTLSGRFIDRWWYGHAAKEVHEEELYASLGFSWQDKYDYFRVIRDSDREDFVYSKVINDEEPYIFVGDDPSRNYIIDVKRAIGNQDIKIVRSHDLLQYGLFDLLKVIEKAQSVHVMYNAWFTLCDCMKLNKIYLHNSYLNKIDPLETYGEPMKNLLSYRNITAI